MSKLRRCSDPQQKIHCVFADVSERIVLLSRHKIDVKEDIVTSCEQERRH